MSFAMTVDCLVLLAFPKDLSVHRIMPDPAGRTCEADAVQRLDGNRPLNRQRWRLLCRIANLLSSPMTVLAFIWIALLILDSTEGLSPWFSALNWFIWGLFVLVLGVLLVGYLADVFLVFFSAILAAVLIRGLSEGLSRYTHLPIAWSLGAVVLLLAGLLVLLGWLIVFRLNSQMDPLTEEVKS